MEEKNIIRITAENVLNVINSGVFGSIIVDFETKEAENMLIKAIDAANLLVRGSVYMKEYVESVPVGVAGWIDEVVPEVYRLHFTRDYEPNCLNADDIRIQELAMRCKNEGVSVNAEINMALHPFARKMAKVYNVKFGSSGFIASENVSIMDRIKKELESGAYKMDFTTSETTIHTLRAYCSLIRAEFANAAYCRQIGKTLTVFFREATPQEAAVSTFADALNEMVATGVISEATAREIEWLAEPEEKPAIDSAQTDPIQTMPTSEADRSHPDDADF